MPKQQQWRRTMNSIRTLVQMQMRVEGNSLNLSKIMVGIKRGVRITGRIAPEDLPVETWWLDSRLDLRLLQCSCEVGDELEDGENDCARSWPDIYSCSENPRGNMVKMSG